MNSQKASGALPLGKRRGRACSGSTLPGGASGGLLVGSSSPEFEQEPGSRSHAQMCQGWQVALPTTLPGEAGARPGESRASCHPQSISRGCRALLSYLIDNRGALREVGSLRKDGAFGRVACGNCVGSCTGVPSVAMALALLGAAPLRGRPSHSTVLWFDRFLILQARSGAEFNFGA